MAQVIDQNMEQHISELARKLAQKRGLKDHYEQQDWEAAERQAMEETSLTEGSVWKAENLCEQSAPEITGLGRDEFEPTRAASDIPSKGMETGVFKEEYLGR